MRKQETLFFLHLPKAGGTTLYHIINRNHLSNSIFHIEATDLEKSLKAYSELSKKEKDDLKCIKGHFPFGIHQKLGKAPKYFTMLRNPVERIISHYYYVRNNRNHYLYEQVKEGNISLYDYVASDISHELENGQTKLIAGDESVKCDQELYEEAKFILNKYFIAVGILEYFNLSLILYKKKLGWKRINYKKRNVTRSKPSLEEIDEKTINIIEEKNKFDIYLYDYVEKLFWKNIYEENINKTDLKIFEIKNNLYGNYRKIRKIIFK